jgi:hypothetical protein
VIPHTPGWTSPQTFRALLAVLAMLCAGHSAAPWPHPWSPRALLWEGPAVQHCHEAASEGHSYAGLSPQMDGHPRAALAVAGQLSLPDRPGQRSDAPASARLTRSPPLH